MTQMSNADHPTGLTYSKKHASKNLSFKNLLG